ncbi:peptide chain release factor 2 [Buchnera aphidicola (Periphyllus koelreuteriae)]|uniref:peptide chain release factor 2 n=1 Tax=Buchnera aphidicola TaxID=9 RepID=UPI0031B8778E
MKNLGNIFELKKIKRKFLEINIKLENKKKWNNFNYIKKYNKKKKKLFKKIYLLKYIKNKIKENKNLLKLSLELSDVSLLKDIQNSLKKIKKKINYLKFKNMFIKKIDKKNCYLEIQSGSGGIDSQDWSKILLKMYLNWTYKKKFKTQIINIIHDELNGIKSATIKIKGKYAFGWLRTESGIHRLVRKSPFNSENKRHTSFSSVYIYPIIKKKNINEIKKSDLKIDVYKSSGSGGQHVNKTESAVRIKHIPTGIVVQCQNNRSQHKNKKQAIQQIKSKILNIEIKQKKKEKKEIDKKKYEIKWGNQIRSYILDDSRIKDLRTGLETKNIHNFLNGKIDKFIKKSLKLGF